MYVIQVTTQLVRDVANLFAVTARGLGESFTRSRTSRAAVNFNTTRRLGRQRSLGLSYPAVVAQIHSHHNMASADQAWVLD